MAWPIAAAIGLGAANSVLGYIGAREQNDAARDMAMDQMAFQERMSNTQYQRAVKDMKAAGLNPMLAYQQGGASSPVGASAPVVNTWDGNTGGVSTAMQGIRLKQELDNLKANENLTKAQMDREVSQTALNNANRMQAQISTALASQELPGALNRAEVEQSKLGKWLAPLNKILESIGRGAQSVRDLSAASPSKRYHILQ